MSNMLANISSELENQKLRKHVHAKMLQTLSDQGVSQTHIAQL